MTGPDPNSIYPNENVRQVVYIKNVITRPNIEVGDYTYYDDVNGAEQGLNATELNEYADRLSLSYGSASPWYYASGIKAEKTTTFMMKITDPDIVTIHQNGLVNQSYQNTDDGASAGKVVGYAILRLWGGSSSIQVKPNNEYLKVTYQAAKEEIQQGEAYTVYPAAIGDDVYGGEELQLAAQLVVVPLPGLLLPAQVLVQLLLFGEGDAVDPLEHFPVGVAPPVGAAALGQLEGVALDPAGGVQMGAGAQVGELALAVEGNDGVLRQIVRTGALHSGKQGIF